MKKILIFLKYNFYLKYIEMKKDQKSGTRFNKIN